METRQIALFGALAFLGFLLYQEWQKDYGSLAAPVQSSASADSPFGDDSSAPVAASTVTGDLPTAASVTPTSVSAAAASPAGKQSYAKVETDTIAARVSNRGGTVTDLKLLKYPKVKKRPNDLVQLLNHQDAFYFVAQGGLVFGGYPQDQNPSHFADYELISNDGGKLVYRWQNNGVTVDKELTFVPGSYETKINYQVQNNSDKPLTVQSYGQLVRSGATDVPPPPFVQTFLGGAVYEQKGEGFGFEKTKLSKFYKKDIALKQEGGWVAMIQHHFAGAIIPPANKQVIIDSAVLAGPDGSKAKDYRADDRFRLRYVSANPEIVPVGGVLNIGDTLYVGPKLHNNLKEAAKGLPLAVDYGFFTIIAEPLFWVLKKLYQLTANWGVAIILLTFLVKIFFYKPSEWQYRSMAKMRKFAPKIKALKDRYGDDREKLNQAMMKLYKDEKFNPFGGCLPLLIQMPVFIALYWVLIESVELRQAPFFLWLNDLTSPDPLYILPLIFAVSMFAQQRLMAASGTMDPMQEKVMMFMPIGMGIFFAFFPSGLVLYWVVNNLLSILQQWYITRKVEQEDTAKA